VSSGYHIRSTALQNDVGGIELNSTSKTLLLPVLLITVGTGWMLTELGIAPNIDWVWTLGLAMIGILPFILSGIDKFSIVVGPFFITTSILSVLRQTEQLSLNIEFPIIVITMGILLLIARSSRIPAPCWIIHESNKEKN
jgi:hypothetical protein